MRPNNYSIVCFTLLAIVALSYGQKVPNTPGFQVSANTQFELLATSGQSKYYRIQASHADGSVAYSTPPYFLRLAGSRFNMGADFATLAGKDVEACFEALLNKINISQAERESLSESLLTFGVEQWEDWLSKQVSAVYLQEIAGIKSVSNKVYRIITSTIVLANLPSDMPEDFVPVLEDERANPNYPHTGPGASPSSSSSAAPSSLFETLRRLGYFDRLFGGMSGFQCSMYAVWGSRTAGNQLFSCRNLDYTRDMGINPWKSVTMWVPDDGAHPHVAYGFLPLYGVLSGNNAAGITVHEANLEEKNETFRGYPWVLRLRHVMENSANLAEAMQLWYATNNTIGYNHMLASSADAGLNTRAASVFETAAFYNGQFYDNSTVEATALHNGQVYGYPLPEALWRTNHPYDPRLSADYLWWTFNAYKWSQQRYMFIHQSVVEYEAASVPIDYIQAINITSVVADKGQQSPYLCTADASAHGANILSVTHQPKSDMVYVAWDDSEGATWSPACCNTYIAIDLSKWWSQ